MQSKLIVFRTTAVGALCLSGAVASCVGFRTSGVWLPYAIIAVGTLIMWTLGRTLQAQVRGRMHEEQRIGEVTRQHAAHMREHTETARAMASSLADRALAESRQQRSDPEARKLAEISEANVTLAERLLGEAVIVAEKLEAAITEVQQSGSVVSTAQESSGRTAAALQEIHKAATDVNRLVVNRALGRARGDMIADDNQISRAIRELATLIETVAEAHGEFVGSLAESQHREATMLEVQTSLARVMEALGTLSEGLRVFDEGWTTAAEFADVLAKVCVDARFIARELGALQGADSDDGVTTLTLPPHPLNWDQFDGEVHRDVHAEQDDDTIDVDP